MDESKSSLRILDCIVKLAKALQLTIVAEGIETQKQMHGLRKLGCEFGQGYYFSKPKPLNELLNLVSFNPSSF